MTMRDVFRLLRYRSKMADLRSGKNKKPQFGKPTQEQIAALMAMSKG